MAQEEEINSDEFGATSLAIARSMILFRAAMDHGIPGKSDIETAAKNIRKGFEYDTTEDPDGYIMSIMLALWHHLNKYSYPKGDTPTEVRKINGDWYDTLREMDGFILSDRQAMPRYAVVETFGGCIQDEGSLCDSYEDAKKIVDNHNQGKSEDEIEHESGEGNDIAIVTLTTSFP